MKLKTTFFFFLFFGNILFLSAQSIQNSTKREIHWIGIETWNTDKFSKKVLSFENAQYPSENDLPYYVEAFQSDKNAKFNISLKNEEFIPLTQAEEELIGSSNIPEDIAVTTFETFDKGTSLFNVQILPFAKKDGHLLKLKSFDLQIEKSLLPQKSPSALLHTYASSSVLSSGKFVKIKIQQSGIYKITYETLASMGINPANVRVFGYGGALLDEDFSKSKIDDLPEVAIWMEKGTDGVFNAGDYILFYAQGVIKWNYDSVNGIFTHTLNNYSNDGFYFLTSDAGDGKKIQDKTITIPSDAVIKDVDEFNDYQVHELELINLGKTGKVFYGETFDTNLSYTFPFSFPNVTNSNIKARLDVAAISSDDSNFVLGLNGGTSQSLTVLKKSTDYYEIGKSANAILTFPNSNSTVQFTLTYNKPNSTAVGYLNYLEVNVRRKLTMDGSALFFRNVDNLNTANYSHYQISGANNNVQIWDVTDPSNIKRIVTTRNGDYLEFTDSNEILKQYLAIDPTAKSAFSEPVSVGTIPNQNIHGMPQADLVIITHPNFITQANKLADAHRSKDNLKVNVVTTDQVYNEFSSGTPDATSYRWVMKMFYDRALASGDVSSLPKYLLLFGRGSYDNRGLFKNSGDNLILTYQADMSLDAVKSYVTDDYFGLLDDNEGTQITSQLIDVGIGRFPASTSQHADDVVNKTISYMNNSIKGIWKNQLCFLADDGDGALHMKQSDSIAQSLKKLSPAFQYDKIYLDAFKQEISASGQSYPLAKTKLHNLINSGLFLFNFTGHASENGLTNEQIITKDDALNLYNPKLPLWIAATCDFVLFDVKDISTGEHVVLNPSGGGVALLSAARTVYASQNERLNRLFTLNLFQKTNGQYPRLGDALAAAKNKTGVEINKLSFVLLGDPALKLNYPTKYNIVTEKLNDKVISSTDTLKALSVNKIQGYVTDENGSKVNDFNGLLEIAMYDKLQKITTLNNEGDGALTYEDRPNMIYSGKARIKNGEFTFTMMVPRDIRYNYGTGRINYYASDSIVDREAQGYYENFIVGGSISNFQNETNGPDVNLYLNSPNFVSGGKVNETPYFVAHISDQSGINTVGSGIGHDLKLVIDDNPYNVFILNDYFEAETDSYQAGSVRMKLPEMTAGKHTLTFSAWDLLNNSTTVSANFEVVPGLTPVIFNVYNYPNPVRTATTFVIENDRPQTILETTVEVFDLSGRTIFSTKQNNAENVTWNLKDSAGNRVQPGVYIYRISIKTSNSEQTSKSNKIVVIGQ